MICLLCSIFEIVNELVVIHNTVLFVTNFLEFWIRNYTLVQNFFCDNCKLNVIIPHNDRPKQVFMLAAKRLIAGFL